MNRICHGGIYKKYSANIINSLKNLIAYSFQLEDVYMMMMMMNCFCGMVDRRKAFSLISSRDHCQRSSPSWISDTPRAGFEPAQNLSFFEIHYSKCFQKQPPRGIPENMQKIYTRTPMPKCDFNKVALQL